MKKWLTTLGSVTKFFVFQSDKKKGEDSNNDFFSGISSLKKIHHFYEIFVEIFGFCFEVKRSEETTIVILTRKNSNYLALIEKLIYLRFKIVLVACKRDFQNLPQKDLKNISKMVKLSSKFIDFNEFFKNSNSKDFNDEKNENIEENGVTSQRKESETKKEEEKDFQNISVIQEKLNEIEKMDNDFSNYEKQYKFFLKEQEEGELGNENLKNENNLIKDQVIIQEDEENENEDLEEKRKHEEDDINIDLENQQLENSINLIKSVSLERNTVAPIPQKLPGKNNSSNSSIKHSDSFQKSKENQLKKQEKIQIESLSKNLRGISKGDVEVIKKILLKEKSKSMLCEELKKNLEVSFSLVCNDLEMFLIPFNDIFKVQQTMSNETLISLRNNQE